MQYVRRVRNALPIAYPITPMKSMHLHREVQVVSDNARLIKEYHWRRSWK